MREASALLPLSPICILLSFCHYLALAVTTRQVGPTYGRGSNSCSDRTQLFLHGRFARASLFIAGFVQEIKREVRLALLLHFCLNLLRLLLDPSRDLGIKWRALERVFQHGSVIGLFLSQRFASVDAHIQIFENSVAGVNGGIYSRLR